MLVIAIHRADRPRDDGLRQLSHERMALGDRVVCDVFFDAARWKVTVADDALTVADATAGLGTVCCLSGRDLQGTLAKPLMLGLPLYYATSSTTLLVATQVRLLKAFGVSMEENSSVLPEYFVFRFVTPPNTLLKHVLRLPVGASLDVSIEGDRVRTSDVRWTKAFERDQSRYALAEGVERSRQDLLARFETLKQRQGSVACLLSGGLDSSVLYQLGKDALSLSESHSTGYPFEDAVHEGQHGERHYAETASAALGSAHRHHTFTTSQFLRGMVESIDRAEMPLHHLQSILLGLLFQHGLKKTDRIVLCGQGADGIVGLSVMFNYLDKKYLLRRELSPLFWAMAAVVPERLAPFGRLHRWSLKKWDLDFARPDHALWMLGEFGERAWVRDHFGVDDMAIVHGRLSAISKFNVESVLDAFSILDFVSDVGVTQDIWGQLAAAHGRTAYYPFNSPGLINAALHVSWEDKLSEPKRLMRALGVRVGVPDFILSRPKLGFGVRSALWAARGGAAEPLLDVAAPVVDVELLRRFQGTDEKRAMILWNWLNYAIWKRLIVDDEPRDRLMAELDEAISRQPAR